MKLALVVSLITYSNFSLANTIDRLRTTEEVVEFAKSVNPDFNKDTRFKFQLRASETIAKDLQCGGIVDEWNIKNWEKADLNNDGLTDLLIMPYWYEYKSYAIIDKGKGRFKVHEISRSPFEECELSKPLRMGKKNYLKIYQKRQETISLTDVKEVIVVDTLTFKFDELVELNDQPADYSIRSVTLQQSSSEIGPPVFSLKITREGDTEYDREPSYVYKDKEVSLVRKGNFKKNLGQETFIGLVEMLNYIKIKELRDSYSVSWFHAGNITLTVEFANGEVKEISDYGMQGTFGLMAVYSRLTELASQIEE